MKQELTASRVFSAMSVFDVLRSSLEMILGLIPTLVRGTTLVAEFLCHENDDDELTVGCIAKVSLDRANDFFSHVGYSLESI